MARRQSKLDVAWKRLVLTLDEQIQRATCCFSLARVLCQRRDLPSRRPIQHHLDLKGSLEQPNPSRNGSA
jgi:hypothetical protein